MLLLSCGATARDIDHVLNEVEDLRDRIRERVSQQVEERMQTQVRARVRVSVEDSITESIATRVNDSLTQDTLPRPRQEDAVTEQRQQPVVAARVVTPEISATIDRLREATILNIEESVDLLLDTVVDDQGRAALSNQWLVMTDQAGLDSLAASGFEIIRTEGLEGLGFILGTIAAPASFEPTELTLAAVQVIDSSELVVDLNHVYLPQRDPRKTVTSHKVSRSVPGQNRVRIGMIDSAIDQDHPVFEDASIDEAIFTPRGFSRAELHGTAIASILVGQSEAFTGFSPGSSLFSGVVFAQDENGNEFSTTAAIVRAINWLAEQNVSLINMSLAGPDNAILRRAVESACDRGIHLITSVGNAGPTAAPLYPAAYDCTIAVTGVDQAGLPYHRANRGPHVDFALPGVDVLHAIAGGGYGSSSGTSYAAATLTGMIAGSADLSQKTPGELRLNLNALVKDLGKDGADVIYGAGLLLPTAYISD